MIAPDSGVGNLPPPPKKKCSSKQKKIKKGDCSQPAIRKGLLGKDNGEVSISVWWAWETAWISQGEEQKPVGMKVIWVQGLHP